MVVDTLVLYFSKTLPRTYKILLYRFFQSLYLSLLLIRNHKVYNVIYTKEDFIFLYHDDKNLYYEETLIHMLDLT